MASHTVLLTMDYLALIELIKLTPSNKSIHYNGHKLHIRTERMNCLFRSRKCAHCNKVGEHWELRKTERAPDRGGDQYDMVLVARDGSVLTRDHIHPVSKGGGNLLDNSQTLCFKCNQAKADRVLDDF